MNRRVYFLFTYTATHLTSVILGDRKIGIYADFFKIKLAKANDVC